MLQYRSVLTILSLALTSDTRILQAYITLCSIKEWGEEWKGVKLPRLYILLREQFTHPDDPWCAETLEWWNEFRLGSRSTLRVLTVF